MILSLFRLILALSTVDLGTWTGLRGAARQSHPRSGAAPGYFSPPPHTAGPAVLVAHAKRGVLKLRVLKSSPPQGSCNAVFCSEGSRGECIGRRPMPLDTLNPPPYTQSDGTPKCSVSSVMYM